MFFLHVPPPFMPQPFLAISRLLENLELVFGSGNSVFFRWSFHRQSGLTLGAQMLSTGYTSSRKMRQMRMTEIYGRDRLFQGMEVASICVCVCSDKVLWHLEVRGWRISSTYHWGIQTVCFE